MIRVLAVVALFVGLSCGVAHAYDVLVRVQVIEGKADPATDDPNVIDLKGAKVALSIETAGPVGGDFHAEATIGGRKVELEGSVKQSGKDPYRVSIKFADGEPAKGTQQSLSTNIEVPLDRGRNKGTVLASADKRMVVLTITPKYAK